MRLTILLACLFNILVAHAADKPNIVVILADDGGLPRENPALPTK